MVDLELVIIPISISPPPPPPSPLLAEMPGLKVLRRKTCASTGDKPLSGAKIIGCTHVTAQLAVSHTQPIIGVSPQVIAPSRRLIGHYSRKYI